MSTDAEPDAEHKAFISYSWSTPEHKTWVRNLAERMTEDGVVTILDQWDLKPGHDPLHFMEQSITDPKVKKVLIICDRLYKEKADGRSGGVGTETQILTPEIYRKTDQGKYAALVTEVDEDGRAYVPTFYGGRIFIDFSDPERHEEAYEELTRWINDAPLHTRPKLGKKPAFLTQDDAKPLATQSRFRRAKEGLDKGASNATGLIRDFGEGMVEQLVTLRSAKRDVQGDEPALDDAVIEAADAMRPYVRQFLELTRATVRNAQGAFDDLLLLLEAILATTERATYSEAWSPETFDANRIMAYEAFLGFVATLLGERQFDLLEHALNHPYYFDDQNGGGRTTKEFEAFNAHVGTLDYRNQRKGENRADWQADFVKQHYQTGWPSMDRMMEADLLLYLKAPVANPGSFRMWYPHTLVYAGRRATALEIFARMESVQFFAGMSAKLFGSVDAPTFKARVRELAAQRLWRGLYPGPSIGSLAGIEFLAVRP